MLVLDSKNHVSFASLVAWEDTRYHVLMDAKPVPTLLLGWSDANPAVATQHATRLIFVMSPDTKVHHVVFDDLNKQ